MCCVIAIIAVPFVLGTGSWLIWFCSKDSYRHDRTTCPKCKEVREKRAAHAKQVREDNSHY